MLHEERSGGCGLAARVRSGNRRSGMSRSSRRRAVRRGLRAAAELSRAPRTAHVDDRLDSQLGNVVATARQQGAQAALRTARANRLDTVSGRIRVVVEATPGDARDAVAARGGSVEATAGQLTEALVPPGSITAVSTARGVSRYARRTRRLRSASKARGSRPSEARCLAHGRCDRSRSEGRDHRPRLRRACGPPVSRRAATSGAGLTTVDYCGGSMGAPEEHGTAVAEIVHEMAPDAQLYAICVDSEVGLANASAYAKAAGITIVNHSVGWYNTSRGDGTGAAGTPDAIVASARTDGILWVNAAGNAGAGALERHVLRSRWRRLSQLLRLRRKQLDRALPRRGGLRLPEVGRLADDEGGLRPPSGRRRQSGCSSRSPRTTSRTARCRPPRHSATRTPTARLMLSRSRSTAGRRPSRRASTSSSRSPTRSNTRTPQAASSSLRPRRARSPSAPSAWQGNSLEPYSSVGPTIDGRVKPDLAAPSAVTSAIYGAFNACASSGFTGTSSAAPHVAGAAALLRAMFPLATHAELQAFLEEEALDLGAAGMDSLFGAGVLLLPASQPLADNARADCRPDRHRQLGRLGLALAPRHVDDLPL